MNRTKLFAILIGMTFMLMVFATVASTASASPDVDVRGKPEKPPKPPKPEPSGVGSAGPDSQAGADGVVHKYALVVGVSDYIDPGVGDLSYCDDDARDWTSWLRTAGYSVDTLIDRQATEPAIESALFDIISSADADDKIIFATSGHGTIADRMQVLLYADCYAPNTDGDGFVGGVVPDLELKNWFAKCTSEVFIFVDHCNSGGLNEAVHTNMIMTTTCGARGYGYDVPSYANGAWTYWFLEQALVGQGYDNVEDAYAWASANYPYGGKDAPCKFDSFAGLYFF